MEELNLMNREIALQKIKEICDNCQDTGYPEILQESKERFAGYTAMSDIRQVLTAYEYRIKDYSKKC